MIRESDVGTTRMTHHHVDLIMNQYKIIYRILRIPNTKLIIDGIRKLHWI